MPSTDTAQRAVYLRACYAMSGTDLDPISYARTTATGSTWTKAFSLTQVCTGAVSAYAVSGTEVAYGGTGRSLRGTGVVYGAVAMRVLWYWRSV
eukprot:2810342-Rhodomonas_salina.1